MAPPSGSRATASAVTPSRAAPSLVGSLGRRDDATVHLRPRAQDLLGEKESLRAGWDGARWMERAWAELREKRIWEISLPGTHNSGAARLSRDVAPDHGGAKILELRRSLDSSAWLRRSFGRTLDGICKHWSETQDLSIEKQLLAGVRYLDCRVARDASMQL
ncbi:hypothetical protein T484DRAFT_1790190 [Baffinella frigidus]|nr:hypothetical protein T484DRAFT_1790190 [Cryptophyta sp. CCMP2293]